MTRRQALQRVASAALAGAAASTVGPLSAQPAPPAPPPPAATGPFTLPPLGYATDALEPFVDAQTMQIHHDRHHAAYVANLNKAVAGHPELTGKSVDELLKDLNALPETVRTAIRNNGGGHANHSLFWQWLNKNEHGKPGGELAAAMDAAFGGFTGFQEQFTKTALGVFGSGWAWLTLDGRQLRIEGTSNQDTPWSHGRLPLLGLDVWEHAYYLKYQNRRPEYVAAFYHVINWDFVAERFQKAMA